MTMPGQVDIVERLVNDAVERGAKVLVGGKPSSDRRFFAPTVLVDVDHSMAITREETFGPVMCIMRVRDEDEAIERANDSRFGLSSSVFSTDHERARRIGRRLVAGSTCMNEFALGYMVQALPFGGIKDSGFGRLNGREGLRACTNPKAYVDDRFPFHRAVELFPVRPGAYELTRGAIRLVYDSNWRRKLEAAIDLGRSWWAHRPRRAPSRDV
jgi:acyl-CoA reductase-like NAD-dependent aldehyde dehydrogenase